MTPEVWRHIPSTGEDYTLDETEPGVFMYRYRPCECSRFDPKFYRPARFAAKEA